MRTGCFSAAAGRKTYSGRGNLVLRAAAVTLYNIIIMNIFKYAIPVFFILSLSSAAGAQEKAGFSQSLNNKEIQSSVVKVSGPSEADAAVEELAGRAAAEGGAVIVTVPGIKASSLLPWFSGKELRAIAEYDTSDGARGAVRSAGVSDEELQRSINAAMKEYYRLPENFDPAAVRAQGADRLSDDFYLENRIRRIPGFASRNIEVSTFRWSRNADDSAQYIPSLMLFIRKAYEKAMSEGKPLYVFAHSWGTMLTHTALHRLEYANLPIKVEAWITTGSPLVPSNFIVETFVNSGVSSGNLVRKVSKPKTVKYWLNIWASRDLIANEIQTADRNVRIDGSVAPYEKAVLALVGISSGDANMDLIKLRNVLTWHSSYFDDYSADLKSINKTVRIKVFEPFIQPVFLK